MNGPPARRFHHLETVQLGQVSPLRSARTARPSGRQMSATQWHERTRRRARCNAEPAARGLVASNREDHMANIPRDTGRRTTQEQGVAFDPESVELMTDAYLAACQILGLRRWRDAARSSADHKRRCKRRARSGQALRARRPQLCLGSSGNPAVLKARCASLRVTPSSWIQH
jgi:hypothetical protein